MAILCSAGRGTPTGAPLQESWLSAIMASERPEPRTTVSIDAVRELVPVVEERLLEAP